MLRAHILSTRPGICGICSQPVDVTLSGQHPDGPHVDHITPVARGGAEFDPRNCRITHNRCNLKRGTTPDQVTTSREW